MQNPPAMLDCDVEAWDFYQSYAKPFVERHKLMSYFLERTGLTGASLALFVEKLGLIDECMLAMQERKRRKLKGDVQ